MNVLVINCGSSSLKYQLFDMKNETVMAKGLVERIGLKGSSLVQKINGKENYVINEEIKDHKIAVRLVLDALVDSKYGVIKSTAEINAVGHRVVHGGEYYSSSVLIDEKVMKAIEDCVKLAPLHNPPNLIGINACRELMPNIPMVAVFDTAFHQTMPDKAFMYALPYEFYKKYGIRKYGFHGTSHKYVSGIAAKMLNKDLKDLKLITCHLGGGSSITAVCHGKSVDTTMGFTPLDGLPMGTRSGSIDPAVVTFLEKYANMTSDDMDTVLNKKSGMLGVSGISSDFRDLKEAIEEKNDKRAEIAVSMFTYKVKQYIGAYIASMNGADAIVFTAGAGENASWLRKRILTDLDFLGIKFDEKRNENNGVNEIISTDDSRIKVLVIPTNEELMIARDTKSISEKLM